MDIYWYLLIFIYTILKIIKFIYCTEFFLIPIYFNKITSFNKIIL